MAATSVSTCGESFCSVLLRGASHIMKTRQRWLLCEVEAIYSQFRNCRHNVSHLSHRISLTDWLARVSSVLSNQTKRQILLCSVLVGGYPCGQNTKHSKWNSHSALMICAYWCPTVWWRSGQETNSLDDCVWSELKMNEVVLIATGITCTVRVWAR